VPPLHPFPCPEDPAKSLAVAVVDGSFSVKDSLLELSVVVKISSFKHALTMVLIVNKVTFITISSLLVTLLAFTMTFVASPLT
jgi:hypothetical protein